MSAASDPSQRLRAIDWTALEGIAPFICAAARRAADGERVDRTLDRLLREHQGFSSQQRTAAAEALFGLSLWRRRLAASAGIPWSDERADAILADHAAGLLCALLRDLGGVDEAPAVELAGVISPPLRQEPRAYAERYSLPDWLWSHLVDELQGEHAAAQFAAAISIPGPIFLRANRLRTTPDALRARLSSEGIETAPCEHATDGLRAVTSRPNLLANPSFREGLFEVQDEGSQLLGELLQAAPGETVLDFCAGAGGKSLQLAARVAPGGQVLCTDIDRAALGRLRTRAERAGARVQIAGAPAELAEDLRVDRVLVDAPCSELGALRRGPDARFRIDRADLESLPALQLELLRAAARHVKPGGRLVYATCTLRHAENQAVAIAFERSQSGFEPVVPKLGLARSFFSEGFFTALPHLHGTDGFFAATWQRR